MLILKSYVYPFTVYKLILLNVIYPENTFASKELLPEFVVFKKILRISLESVVGLTGLVTLVEFNNVLL